MVSYHLTFFALPQNAIGKLEKCIDKGIVSLTKTVKNLFVDIVPMFANAALVLMYKKNIWVGVCATLVLPLYALISREQSKRQKQIRCNIQNFREEKANTRFSLIESIFVVKSFVREGYESGRQQVFTQNLSDSEVRHHRTNYLFDGLSYQTEAKALSGGQQQRIAIAQLFLKNPPIIFLDEPTTSLDAITAEQIKDSIDVIKKDRTVFIISHSISQIMDADQIYVMQEGEIIGSGTHESLYSEGGLYSEIIDSNARTLNIGSLAATVLPQPG